jgi:hypothetical protein
MGTSSGGGGLGGDGGGRGGPRGRWPRFGGGGGGDGDGARGNNGGCGRRTAAACLAAAAAVALRPSHAHARAAAAPENPRNGAMAPAKPPRASSSPLAGATADWDEFDVACVFICAGQLFLGLLSIGRADGLLLIATVASYQIGALKLVSAVRRQFAALRAEVKAAARR